MDLGAKDFSHTLWQLAAWLTQTLLRPCLPSPLQQLSPSLGEAFQPPTKGLRSPAIPDIQTDLEEEVDGGMNQEPGGGVCVRLGEASLFLPSAPIRPPPAQRALTGLGGRRGPRPGGPIPGQTVPSTSSSGMFWAAGPGGRLRVVGGGGGARPTPSNHRRRRAPSRHRRGPSPGRRARRGPRAPGPCPRAGRRGPR